MTMIALLIAALLIVQITAFTTSRNFARQSTSLNLDKFFGGLAKGSPAKPAAAGAKPAAKGKKDLSGGR